MFLCLTCNCEYLSMHDVNGVVFQVCICKCKFEDEKCEYQVCICKCKSKKTLNCEYQVCICKCK